MPGLPTGTVTFLFSDIERSTELVAVQGDRYPALLDRHNELLRRAFARGDGVEVGTEGDAFFVVFTNPSAAIEAAVEAQRALRAEPWPAGGAVLVRMGLHTGEGIVGGDSYVGIDVHRASRIASAGHGGQILVSDATRALVEQALPTGIELLDLGRHRLKGLPNPERIFQVSGDGLSASFPPLVSLEVRPHNLPAEMTSFIGRERQIAELAQRLGSARLLTLTGPGGTGKTRLAIRLAQEVIADYEDGCWFVPLEALREPDLVASTIAGSLGVRLRGDQPVAAALESWLAEREILLVLDNFEQVAAAAPSVAQLLNAASRLRVITTSRAPLHLYGEHEYPVPPMTTLPDGQAPTAEVLSQYEAVRLFIERASAVKPDFQVTNANAPALAGICARLDGLPLAIELAAARIKLLSPEQMLTRLGRSLSLLASSAQDLPERQRTLLGAIGWSHDLLSDPERRLFRRCSVFRGGFSLEAAEQVCGSEDLGIEMFDGLASLVDKSLLRSEELPAEARFTMLETIREFARERLIESGELEALTQRHAAHFFALAEEAGHSLSGPDQLNWLDRLEREHDNLRAAFSRHGEAGLLDESLRAAGAMWRFWQLRGYFAEASAIFDRLLAARGGTGTARAKALTGAGGIAYWRGSFEKMADHYREARELYEAADDMAGMAEAFHNESYAPLLLEGDFASAKLLLERSIELYRRTGNELGAAEAETMLGFSHYFEGAPELARQYQERAVETYRRVGARWQLSDNLLGLSWVLAQMGDWQQAASAWRESLALAVELGIEVGVAMTFEGVGAAAAWTGEVELGARLLGKADAMKERLRGAAPSQLVQTEHFRGKAREELGETRYEELRAEGRELSTAKAVDLAQRFEPPADAPPMAKPSLWGVAAGSRDGEVREQTRGSSRGRGSPS